MSNWNDIAAWKKFLDVFTKVFIAIDVLLIALGLSFATGLIDADMVVDVFDMGGSVGGDVTAATVAITMGVAMVVSYVINLICLLFVRRGLKNTEKMTVGLVLFAIISALAIIDIITSLIGGAGASNLLSTVCTAILDVIVLIGCYKVRAEG